MVRFVTPHVIVVVERMGGDEEAMRSVAHEA